MPFKSQAQRRFMYANYPKIAKRWSKHTSKNAELPEYVKESFNECYEFKDAIITDGGHEATALFTLTKVPRAELALVFDLSNPELPPDYVQGVIRDLSTNEMHPFQDPNDSEELLSNYGLEPQDVENEILQQGVEQVEAKLESSRYDDGVRESLEFEDLFDKIINS